MILGTGPKLFPPYTPPPKCEQVLSLDDQPTLLFHFWRDRRLPITQQNMRAGGLEAREQCISIYIFSSSNFELILARFLRYQILNATATPTTLQCTIHASRQWNRFFLGSGPGGNRRGRSPVEYRGNLSVRTSVRPSVRPSPPPRLLRGWPRPPRGWLRLLRGQPRPLSGLS